MKEIFVSLLMESAIHVLASHPGLCPDVLSQLAAKSSGCRRTGEKQVGRICTSMKPPPGKPGHDGLIGWAVSSLVTEKTVEWIKFSVMSRRICFQILSSTTCLVCVEAVWMGFCIYISTALMRTHWWEWGKSLFVSAAAHLQQGRHCDIEGDPHCCGCTFWVYLTL